MMGHKVLFDGNGSRLVCIVGVGEFLPAGDFRAVQEQNQQLAAQNAELVAHVEALRDAYCEFCEQNGNAQSLHDAFARTPDQHLRDRDAEVVAKAANLLRLAPVEGGGKDGLYVMQT